MILACFQRAGILAELTELLRMLQRNEMPHGPRCFRCSAVMSSGPVAVEFLRLVMADCTFWVEKGLKLGSSLWVLWIALMIFRVLGLRLWVDTEVNCLLNLFAME